MPRDQVTFPEVEAPVDVGAERLRILADFLPSVPVERFDIRDWACGTVACACGHATTIPAFREAGLELVPVGVLGSGTKGLKFGKHRDFNAAAAFFDISSADTDRLFGQLSYGYGRKVTPADVAARIREHLATRRDTLMGTLLGRIQDE